MHPLAYLYALAAAYWRGCSTPPAPSEYSAALEGAWPDNVTQFHRETGEAARDRSAVRPSPADKGRLAAERMAGREKQRRGDILAAARRVGPIARQDR